MRLEHHMYIFSFDSQLVWFTDSKYHMETVYILTFLL